MALETKKGIATNPSGNATLGPVVGAASSSVGKNRSVAWFVGCCHVEARNKDAHLDGCATE
jgi:hypothetical protein